MKITIQDDFDLQKIADSGQCFRFNVCKEGLFRAVAKDKCLYIKELGRGEYDFSCSQKEYEDFWKNYLDLDICYRDIRGRIDKDADPYLYAASEYGKGIRILRQDPWEMLISFIISQRKNIPAIKSCVEALCSKYGRRIEDERAEGGFYYAFPTAEELAAATDEELRTCSLGYRAPYIKAAAMDMTEYPFLLEGLLPAEYEDLMAALKGFKGVGEKVANCISLFAYHRIDAFPVDVWIQRILDAHYPEGFPFERYKGFAGIMQQYMFFYAISHK